MKAKQIEALESYFKTDNEHWNDFIFDMLCEVLQQGQFENTELPLQLFSNTINTFIEHHKTPLKAVQLFAGELDKNNLSGSQKLFIYEYICKYLEQSEFEEMDLTPVKDLLESQKEKLKAETQPVKPLVKNIRETLKEMMQKELEQLPDTLKELEPAKRLNILCKLIPFVLPKVEAVHSEKDEPSESGFNW